MCLNVESMVQDKSPEQEMLVVQEQFPLQPNPEPEMGTAAAAVDDTSPSLLRNPPPIPAETAHPSALDMAQLFAMLAEIKKNVRDFMERMDAHTKAFRSNMQSLQAGIRAFACDERRTAGGKMATPRAGANELSGSATAVRPAMEAGEDRSIRETCWARVVTEEVTVTEGKINWGDGDVHE